MMDLGLVQATTLDLELRLLIAMKCRVHGGVIRAQFHYAGPKHLKLYLAQKMNLCPACLTPCAQALTQTGFDRMCRALDGDALAIECERVRPGAAQGATWECTP